MAMLYEYAVLRVVPKPEREEYLNAGVVLYCREAVFLRAKVHLDAEKIRALDAAADPKLITSHLETADIVCRGGRDAGALGGLSMRERFGRVVAIRNTVIQTSAVHTGLTGDPESALHRLMGEYVLPG